MTRLDAEGFGPRAGARAAVPAQLPRVKGSMAFLRQGHGFISSHCDRLGVDGFRARLMGREAICLRGPEAAALLYGRSGLTRVGAMPTPLRLLHDKGTVQQLEGDEHRKRKAMFIRLVMDPARLESLVKGFECAWRRDLRAGSDITVLDHANTALTRAVCNWAGLQLSDAELARMTRTLSRPSHSHFGTPWSSLMARRMLTRTFTAIRAGRITAPEGTALAVMAELPPKTAAAELLNILRPVVSVGRYIAFAALALHDHPMWCALFRQGNTDYLDDFCEEVRRISPVFPFTAAIATQELVWQSTTLPAGSWLLLDIHGTNRDPKIFPAPDRFRPERMLDWKTQDDCFIPQGAGKVERSHRCPGEAATLALMTSAVKMLCCEMTYELPPQDLAVAMNRIPAQPASGVRIRVQRID